ncbi:MAG: FGGY family carbohydrate kinase [Spirosomataceae bacterium]
MKAWIGVDIGSTNVKAIAINEAGNIVAQASATCVTYRPKNGYIEQDPDEVYRLL